MKTLACQKAIAFSLLLILLFSLSIETAYSAEQEVVRVDQVYADLPEMQVYGSYHFELTITAPAGMRTCLFNSPNGEVFKRFLSSTTGDEQTYIFDISSADVAQVGDISFNVFNSDTERCFIFTYTKQLLT